MKYHTFEPHYVGSPLCGVRGCGKWREHGNHLPRQHPKTHRTIEEEALFLAHEIDGDVMAHEDEIAEAIDSAIRRYAKPIYLKEVRACLVIPGSRTKKRK